jgi:lysozyme
MQQFIYSEEGLALTKSFEGLRTASYQDCAGVWTIGYGHTGPRVIEGLIISQVAAEQFLVSDLADAVTCVNRGVTATISQSQFDAMVDFCFNTGRGSFLESTLLRSVNLDDFGAASAQFGLWVHAGGQVVAGLVRRRKAEADLFGLSEPQTRPAV